MPNLHREGFVLLLIYSPILGLETQQWLESRRVDDMSPLNWLDDFPALSAEIWT